MSFTSNPPSNHHGTSARASAALSEAIVAPQPVGTESRADAHLHAEGVDLGLVAETERGFLSAGLTLIQHAGIKEQLHDLVRRTEERGATIVEELRFAHREQEEATKASVVRRRVLDGLRGQVLHLQKRKERLQRQQQQEKDITLSALEKTRQATAVQRVALENKVAVASLRRKQMEGFVQQLEELLSNAKRDAASVDRAGGRIAKRTSTQAELDHNGDVSRWISILRGEDDADRRRRRLQERIDVSNRRFRSHAKMLKQLTRPQVRAEDPGPMGRESEVAGLLDTAGVAEDRQRVELALSKRERHVKTLLRFFTSVDPDVACAVPKPEASSSGSTSPHATSVRSAPG